jgi:hypothetical protein
MRRGRCRCCRGPAGRRAALWRQRSALQPVRSRPAPVFPATGGARIDALGRRRAGRRARHPASSRHDTRGSPRPGPAWRRLSVRRTVRRPGSRRCRLVAGNSRRRRAGSRSAGSPARSERRSECSTRPPPRRPCRRPRPRRAAHQHTQPIRSRRRHWGRSPAGVGTSRCQPPPRARFRHRDGARHG